MKEKEEEETLLMENYLCIDAHQSCYNTLIREERNNLEKKSKNARESGKIKLQQNRNTKLSN